MSQASTKTTSKEDDADGVHRLRDIVVEEVSFVDRAANQRRFLIVKRSDDMADKSTAKRTGVKKAGATKPEDDELEDEEKCRKKASEDEDDEEDAEKADDASDEEDEDEPSDKRKKKRRKQASEDEDEDDEEDAKKADDTSEDDEEDEASDKRKKKRRKQADALVLPVPEKDALLRVLTESLERLMALATRIKDATPPEDGEEAEVPEEIGEEIEEVTEMLAEVDKKKRKRSKAGVAKAGARMAKDRLNRFQKALTLLAGILKELTDPKDDEDEDEGKPGEPTAGAAESDVQKRAASVPGLTELVSGIGDLTRVVKRQEEELARMRKARGVSNTIPVEGGRRAEPQEVSWPLDMNRPISRDKVRKEVSFFDE